MAEALDPRITPARPDLAASHLRGRVTADCFVDGALQEIVNPLAPLRASPVPDAPYLTEALKGERVTIYETNAEGWSWGQLAEDGYVGWLPSVALSAPGAEPTHTIAVPRTLAFAGPSIKLPPLEALSFGRQLAVVRVNGSYAVTPFGGHIPLRHLAPLGEHRSDFVAVAEEFLGTPYLWGGKSSTGLDCSALVQLALSACGTACPRDSDMQERALGKQVALADVKRGDLLFWKGHVAIARDSGALVHANAFHMAVAIEPLADALARISAAGSEVTSVRRLSEF